jgi:PPE-repeat protein
MVFDFAARTPEINSALMYSGAGAGPLMAAASSFSNLSSELTSNAASYESTISQLTGSEWTGPSSEAMAASAQPYITWLTTTAVQLQVASTQAIASAAAYEAAFSAMIPPPVILANRTTLATLVATNILGQNTPAIAANEAVYGEFWAQDAAAMYAYATSASTASGTLTPLTPPAQNTNPAAAGQQASAVSGAASNTGASTALNQTLGSLQGASSAAANPLSAAASPAADSVSSVLSALNGLFAVPIVGNTIYNIGVTLAWNSAMMTATLPLLGHFLAGSPFGVTISDTAPLGAGLGFGSSLAGASGGVGGATTLAGMGSASSVGGMSVPTGWSAAAPEAAIGETTLAGSGWTAAADETAGMGGGGMNGVMPGMASAGGKSGMGMAGPRYGVKPKVMPKQVFV